LSTLIFPCVGYKIFKLPVNNTLTSNLSVELIEQESILKEVIITNKKNWKSTTLNEFTRCSNNFPGSNGYQIQPAQHSAIFIFSIDCPHSSKYTSGKITI